MRIFCHLASWTKSWNGPVQLLPRVTSLILQATPHWKYKWTTHSPILLMVMLSNLRYFYQKRLDQTSQWQCGTLRTPLELFAKSLWDPQVMKDFEFVLFSPEEIYWLWIICVRQDYISWLVLWSIQQFTRNWKWNDLAQVFFNWYRTLWWFFKYWLFDEEQTQSILCYKLY